MTFAPLNGHVVITGGAGLLGVPLSKALLQTNIDHLTVIDHRTSPSPEPLPIYSERFQLIQESIDSTTSQQAIRSSDYVFHLAASTVMRWNKEEPLRDITGGLMPTINLLETLRSNIKKPRLIYCSSSAVYGNLSNKSVCEADGPLLPVSTYGAAKLTAEAWISAYSALCGINSVICRLGNVISGALDRGALLDIIRQLIKEPSSIKLLGDGKQARTYISTADCASALIYLAALKLNEGESQVINISGKGLIYTYDLVNIAASAMGIPLPQITISASAESWRGDVPIVDLNVEKITSLGWDPPYSRTAVLESVTGILVREKFG